MPQLDTKYRVAPQFGSNSILGIELGVVCRIKLEIIGTIRVRVTWTRISRAFLMPSLRYCSCCCCCCGALLVICCCLCYAAARVLLLLCSATTVVVVVVMLCAFSVAVTLLSRIFVSSHALSLSYNLSHSDTNSSICALCKGQKEKDPTIYRHTYICQWG